jgi:hypothetical protein
MKKKAIGLFVLISVVIFAGLVISGSQEVYSNEIKNAFACLDKGIDDSTSLTLEQAVFASLADVNNAKLERAFADKKDNGEECWGDSGCSVKGTAQVALAKKDNGEGIDSIVNWLKGKSGAIQGLTWYLQISIDNNLQAECSIEYGKSEVDIDVNSDLTLTGNPGSCLSFSNSNYWLKINNGCVDEKFKVTCNESFKTNLLYENSDGGTVYVSASTNERGARAESAEKINAKCFRVENLCDYEASLWATMVLSVNGDDTSNYAPYLKALSDSNRKYFPSAFLYHILGETSGSSELYNEIITSRPLNDIWKITGSPRSKFYDTALAILALGSGKGGADSPHLGDAIEELFDEQGGNSCFGSLADTGLLLYATEWQRAESGAICTDNSNCSNGSCVDGVCVGDGGCVKEGFSTSVDVPNCCAGLSLNLRKKNSDGTCSDAGVYGICTDFSNGRCDNGENVCTNPIDCATQETVGSCSAGYWYVGSPITAKNTSLESGFCHLANEVEWPKGCCIEGYQCSGEGSSSICVFTGDPGEAPVKDTCISGNWFDSNGNKIDTRDVGGYCHLEDDEGDYPYGCCKAGFGCEYEKGNESESICEYRGGGGVGTVLQTDCELAGNYCVEDAYSCIKAGGNPGPLRDLRCAQVLEACCNVDVVEENCFQKGGSICAVNEDCTGSYVSASDGACCTDACIVRVGGETTPRDVGTVTSECSSNSDCGSGKECKSERCVAKKRGSLWSVIIVLIILIGLVTVGIIYRDKLRVWWFKIRGKTKTSRVGTGVFSPGVLSRRTPPRFGRPRMVPPRRFLKMGGVPRKSSKNNAKDKEMEETMKKLKEMSK